jgi:hypothetical protein
MDTRKRSYSVLQNRFPRKCGTLFSTQPRHDKAKQALYLSERSLKPGNKVSATEQLDKQLKRSRNFEKEKTDQNCSDKSDG